MSEKDEEEEEEKVEQEEDEEEKEQEQDKGVSNKSVSWTSTFVTTVLQEHRRRSDVTFLVQTFWTHPQRVAGGEVAKSQHEIKTAVVVVFVLTLPRSCLRLRRSFRRRRLPGMGRMTINKGNFSLLDSRENSPYCHSVIYWDIVC